MGDLRNCWFEFPTQLLIKLLYLLSSFSRSFELWSKTRIQNTLEEVHPRWYTRWVYQKVWSNSELNSLLIIKLLTLFAEKKIFDIKCMIMIWLAEPDWAISPIICSNIGKKISTSWFKVFLSSSIIYSFASKISLRARRPDMSRFSLFTDCLIRFPTSLNELFQLSGKSTWAILKIIL